MAELRPLGEKVAGLLPILGFSGFACYLHECIEFLRALRFPLKDPKTCMLG